jgi:transcription elongation GreA/GreB family factor
LKRVETRNEFDLAQPNTTARSTESPVRVRIGSTVVYADESDPGKECQALITTEESNPQWGMINANTPIAKSLLGAESGQVVTAHLPAGRVQLRVVEIR